MRKLKVIIAVMINFIFFIMLFNSSTLAATDEYKAFIALDRSKYSYDINAISIASKTFQKLGYINLSDSLYEVTNSAAYVKNYMAGTGKNYGLITLSHGDTGAFTLGEKNGTTQWVPASEVGGYWHLVAINSCNSMADDSFAKALHTVGYSKRASLGWYKTVTNVGVAEWWGYFYDVAGTKNLREAALEAASKCTQSTQIRIYGDKNNWNGMAW